MGADFDLPSFAFFGKSSARCRVHRVVCLVLGVRRDGDVRHQMIRRQTKEVSPAAMIFYKMRPEAATS